MPNPKIGLLPLYIELYDKALPQRRLVIEAFRETIIRELEKRGLDVSAAPICRLKNEFDAAVRSFEVSKVDAIVTLHLAYSPSLESSEALALTKLPIIVLDTTPDYEFGPGTDPGQVFSNHGIHGVQDMCNLLLRNGKDFRIEAGHWEKSDVLDRVTAWAKAASMASKMRHARVGRIGNPFQGMGDFSVPEKTLTTTIGIDTIVCNPAVIRSLLPAGDDPDVIQEMARDIERFDAADLDSESHRRTIRASLAVRRWIEKEQLSAFTMNFLEIDQASGLPVVPFLEASKAMARGIGYAGEGDVLTAALVGVLASAFPETTFTEMFCPDWAGNSIFLSHMGELNINLTAGKPLLSERPFPWTNAENPVAAIGRLKGGEAVLVNLAPMAQDQYTFTVVPVTMLDVQGEDKLMNTVHGWFRPQMQLTDFLVGYSEVGATHHSALVYGDVLEEIIRFGEMMGWEVVVLEG